MYTVFNNVVNEMLTDMTERFPSNKQLAACQTFHGMALKMNHKMPYEKFVEYAVIPYGDKLFEHNDTFFMDQHYNLDPESTGFVDALKQLWKDMNEQDRTSVHNYLDLLLSIHQRISLQ